MPGRQLEEIIDPETEFQRKLQESKDALDSFLQTVPLFQVLTDREDRDTMASEMEVKIRNDREVMIPSPPDSQIHAHKPGGAPARCSILPAGCSSKGQECCFPGAHSAGD